MTWKKDKNNAAYWEAFGKAAAKFASDHALNSVVPAITPAEDGPITFENLKPGYYLITSSNGTFAMVYTTPMKPDVIVNEKNPDATLVKEAKEDKNSSWVGNNSAQIGDTVYFKVTIEAKKGAKNYVMHDKMEDGLTFDAESVAIDGLTKGTDYTVVTEGLADDCTFEIRFAQTYLDKVTSNTLLAVTYQAVLNENADVTYGEKNDAKLTWGDKSGTEWSTTTTKTYQFEVLKYDAHDETKSPLAGATFQLKDAAGKVIKLIKVSDTEYRVANGAEVDAVESFTTVDSGKIVIKGVDLDQYTLTEIEAPEGYNRLNEDKMFYVVSGSGLVIEIPNSTGVELPSTGGMGTTIFYTVGGVLMTGAVILLVTKKKMSDQR